MKRLLFICLILLANYSQSQVLTIENKIDSILSKMTFWEKLQQLYPYDVLNTGDNPRLGIPGFYMTDGPHGYRYPESTGGMTYPVPTEAMATSFPVNMAIAATWDTDLAYRMAKSMGNEFVAKGINQPLAPTLYLCNDPRNGRSGESYGEDPYLCAKIGTATVKGIQATPSIATIKSYICENAQNTRMTDTITVSRRMLMEHWGWPFKQAIQDANAMCVMSAYVRVNDTAASHNYTLNTEILRNDWGFPYYMVSDWGSVYDAEKAIKSGLDICMGSWHYAFDLWPLFYSGSLPESYLNKAVKRVLRTKFLSGVIDWQPTVPTNVVSGSESQAINYEAALKSLVLLKNSNNILPLNKNTIGSVAVIGPSAAITQLDGYGSSYVFPTYTVSPLQGIIQKIGGSKVKYAKGCGINDNDYTGFNDAINKAANSDVVIFIGGLDYTQEGETLDRVGGSVELPTIQQILINYLASVNPNIIVVIESGGVVSLSQCLNNIKGLIYGFYPGQEQGHAIADVIFGDYNPGGKLPITMPVNDSQLPPRNNNFNDDWGCGYRWFDKQSITPAFAFGYGLSYTTFTYNSMNILNPNVTEGETISIDITLTNTGNRDGDEVVQLYISHPVSGLPMPVKQLKGFKRVHINSGQTITLNFKLKPEDLYVYDETTASYKLLTGTYTIKAGGASDNLPLNGSFTIMPGIHKPDLSVSSLLFYPPYPHQGDTVFFLANVKNQGIADINNEHLTAEIYLNNQLIAEMDTSISIKIGGMKQIDAHKCVLGKNFWIADAPGQYNLSITLDNTQLIDETDENNNVFNNILTVYNSISDSLEINLAWKKPVISSSFSDSSFLPQYAVDGLRNSRWESDSAINPFFQVDLLAPYQLSLVRIKWADAYANQYTLLSSIDSLQWDTIAVSYFGNGQVDEFNTNKLARYLKLANICPATNRGISIFEFQAFGKSYQSSIENNTVNLFSDLNVFPNPCNINDKIYVAKNNLNYVNVYICDLYGRKCYEELNKNGNIIQIPTDNLKKGIYIIRIDDLNKNYSVFKKIMII
ncbi:MAG: glycoside hydrolase family 3 C-terminal domain-containing protein [Bacteroidales bacterium]|nr:glycoside hydrolase family 3 C-terminal domain-containing protein [Bacteroidales bacterium]